jgi:G:T/U-mismatch repair DNA glycosylase
MREFHPYGEFIPPLAHSMIIGSFPIGKFTRPSRRHEIKKHEIDFFFGGEKNLLWKLLGSVFETDLSSKEAIVNLLKKEGIAIGDVIKSCHRKNGSASDADLYDIEWNTSLLDTIKRHGIKKVFFTSKKVEVWFNKLFPDTPYLEKITLISPSAQSVRALGHRSDFLEWQKNNPQTNKFEFILLFYRKIFNQKLSSRTAKNLKV